MMEIPAGKWCRDSEDRQCSYFHFDVEGHRLCILFHGGGDCIPEATLLEEDEEESWKKVEDITLRCPACLSAYPNGATIEIKPKEGK